jgi:hypothetical protein
MRLINFNPDGDAKDFCQKIFIGFVVCADLASCEGFDGEG